MLKPSPLALAEQSALPGEREVQTPRGQRPPVGRDSRGRCPAASQTGIPEHAHRVLPWDHLLT